MDGKVYLWMSLQNVPRAARQSREPGRLTHFSTTEKWCSDGAAVPSPTVKFPPVASALDEFSCSIFRDS